RSATAPSLSGSDGRGGPVRAAAPAGAGHAAVAPGVVRVPPSASDPSRRATAGRAGSRAGPVGGRRVERPSRPADRGEPRPDRRGYPVAAFPPRAAQRDRADPSLPVPRPPTPQRPALPYRGYR